MFPVCCSITKTVDLFGINAKMGEELILLFLQNLVCIFSGAKKRDSNVRSLFRAVKFIPFISHLRRVFRDKVKVFPLRRRRC